MDLNRRPPGAETDPSLVSETDFSDVLDQDDLVARFVVNQVVDHGLRYHEAKAARTQTFFLARLGVSERIIFRVIDRGMVQFFETKARSRIIDAIEQSARRADK